ASRPSPGKNAGVVVHHLAILPPRHFALPINSSRQRGGAPLRRKTARTVVHHLAILPLRDLALAQPEPARERHIHLVRWLAHLELARRAPAELHPQAVAGPMLAGIRAFG